MNPLLNLVSAQASAMDAYAILAEKGIDLLICDIEMPNMSGRHRLRFDIDKGISGFDYRFGRGESLDKREGERDALLHFLSIKGPLSTFTKKRLSMCVERRF